MRRSNVTLQDIAERTGVSKVTVSYVLNDRQTRVRISDETRRRVQEAAREMGYQPNAVARALTRRCTDTFTLVMQSPHVFSAGSGFITEMMRGVLEGANQCSYDVMLHTKDLGSLDAEVRSLSDGRADGVLVLRDHDDPLIGTLHERGVPSVALFFNPAAPYVPFVDCDNVTGGRLATQHLLELGHRRIAFIAGTSGSSPVAERRRGYQQALARAGIAPDPALDCLIGSAASDFQPLLTLMSGPNPPTALFVWSDDVAARAIALLHDRLGLRVPEDVSVIGFDGAASVCESCIPRLTTVAQPILEIAHRAVELLVQLIRGETPAETQLRLSPEFQAGASTAPPPHFHGGKP